MVKSNFSALLSFRLGFRLGFGPIGIIHSSFIIYTTVKKSSASESIRTRGKSTWAVTVTHFNSQGYILAVGSIKEKVKKSDKISSYRGLQTILKNATLHECIT